MRPPILNPIFAPLTSLPGVGPKQEKLFQHLLGRGEAPARIVDLLMHLPSGAVDRRARPKLRDVKEGAIVTVAVTIDRHRPPPPQRSRAPYLIYASDDTGDIVLTFFKARKEYLEKLLPVGSLRYISGTAAIYDGMLQMVHPDRVIAEADLAEAAAGRAGLSADRGARPQPGAPGARGGAAARTGSCRMAGAESGSRASASRASPARCAPCTSPPSRPKRRLKASHGHVSRMTSSSPARSRWRWCGRICAGRRAASLMGPAHLRKRLIETLPYALTPSQSRAVADIVADLAKPERMLRLLQGDVGSGKTVVSLLAAAAVVEAGRQAALMAPTEFWRASTSTPSHRSRRRPTSSRAPDRARTRARAPRDAREARLRRHPRPDRNARVVPGRGRVPRPWRSRWSTSSIASACISGLRSRSKGEAVDVLVITATPIPRTLVLTYFGDMDMSELREKPPGRRPIDTRTMPLSRLEEVITSMSRALAEGRRIYWVCPLVEESETIDLAAAEERFASLKERFGAMVDCVHGRMKGADKDRAMERFCQRRDPPPGCHHGDRGRRRRARGDRHGDRACRALRAGPAAPAARPRRPRRGEFDVFLLYRPPLGETAKARLEIMRQTEDGFRIAEEDLRLRGEGDVLGTRQSGMPAFRFARLDVHGKYIGAARDDAALHLTRDPDLSSPRGEAVRQLLYLFERDEAVRLLRAG